MAGGRVTRLAVLLGLVVLALDIALSGHPTALFDIGLVLICLGAALAVRPRDFFRVGVLPPLLLLGLITALAIAHRGWVAEETDSLVQAIVSGLANRANALLAAYALTLGVLAMRQRVRTKRRTAAGLCGPVELLEPSRPVEPIEPVVLDEVGYANLDGSPAPTRVTSGGPSEKSTTVVGSEPHSPESITASSQ